MMHLLRSAVDQTKLAVQDIYGAAVGSKQRGVSPLRQQEAEQREEVAREPSPAIKSEEKERRTEGAYESKATRPLQESKLQKPMLQYLSPAIAPAGTVKEEEPRQAEGGGERKASESPAAAPAAAEVQQPIKKGEKVEAEEVQHPIKMEEKGEAEEASKEGEEEQKQKQTKPVRRPSPLGAEHGGRAEPKMDTLEERPSSVLSIPLKPLQESQKMYEEDIGFSHRPTSIGRSNSTVKQVKCAIS